jgi:hypothetical protein
VSRTAVALAAAIAGALVLPAAPAGADSFTPVDLNITVAAVARRHVPLKVGVQVTADPGALDPATSPLRIRVKLAAECGGTFTTTPGTVLLDKALSPQPATGHAYSATMTGSGKPGAYGVQTVCAFLEEGGDNRMFANDTATQVNVSQPCTVDAHKYDAAHRALVKAQRQLRRSHGASARLRRLVAKRSKAAARARRKARTACGTGVAL